MYKGGSATWQSLLFVVGLFCDFRAFSVRFAECPKGLLTETKLLDDGTIALDVLLLEVREETTTLTYELHE